jgi:hypothetical protein
MNKETLEAASHLLGAILGELGLSPEVMEAIQRVAGRMLDEMGRRGVSSGGPSLMQELSAESQRSIVNIVGVANLVRQMGVPPDHVRELIRNHLLHQLVGEQQLVHALLALPRQAQAGDLH